MIDTKEQINRVRRELGPRVLEAGEARELTISQVYDTGLDDLWAVVTEPSRIERWFLPVSGELRIGGALFMKQSSDAWAAADIAAGEKPQEALRRADNTYAFYTGTAEPA
ncbi:hypothetical protein ACQP2E_24280 [Actinoplanes sp. CA-015351]|uniref:hypothetical protein n=1 Tax=Actinoplanes sp. CA-015351 TaxID=3239897 RepID=UPI003D97012C